MPAKPTWDEVATIAKKLNDPSKGRAGICLRGKTGWGENLAPLDTVVNTFGGQWFDTKWNAHLTDPAFKEAVNFYVNLIKDAGEKGAGNFSFNECANAMQQDKAAMWYDATVGASVIDAPGSPIAGKLGFAPAPVMKTENAGWLWSWALSIEGASKHQDAAWTYMSWATSKQYIDYAGGKLGWAAVPPGSRYSTYANPEYQKAAAAFAKPTLDQINAVNVAQPGVSPQPVAGRAVRRDTGVRGSRHPRLAGDHRGHCGPAERGRGAEEGAGLRRDGRQELPELERHPGLRSRAHGAGVRGRSAWRPWTPVRRLCPP